MKERRSENTQSIWIARMTAEEGRLLTLLSYVERKNALVEAGKHKARQLLKDTNIN